VQPSPDDLSRAFLIGQGFLAVGSPSALLLGDKIFFRRDFRPLLRVADSRSSGATIFAYRVQDPERYGDVEFDSAGRAIGLEKKPHAPRSNYAVTSLYFYRDTVVEREGRASIRARRARDRRSQ
jgi:glucose-1-phosphate thymidylyltransferase